MAKITPIGDRVAITPDPAEKQSQSGFVFTENSMEKPKSGTVIAVGDSPSLTLKEGDRVLYGKISGTEIKIKGITYIILRQADILCKVEDVDGTKSN